MKKITLSIFLTFFLCGFVQAGITTVPLVFINCTGQEVQAYNIEQPYKFSLDRDHIAQNGYSKPYSFTIPAKTVFRYNNLTIYRVPPDGSMHLYFSGGITGHVFFFLPVDYYLKMKSDSTSIQAITPIADLDSIAYFVISLGCE